MARVQLIIDDATQRMTLQAMLEAEGHIATTENPEVVFCDTVDTARANARQNPTFVLATASQIPEVVRAMSEGVAGYIFVPLQPREAALAVQRALAAPSSELDEPEEMRTLENVELEYIQAVLRKCRHNQARAARVLGIGRNTLWRKLKRIQPDTQGDAPD